MRTADGRQGYAAISDPPPGARPARDTGVRAAVEAIEALVRQRDEALDLVRAACDLHREDSEAKRREYLRLVGQIADWKAEADRLQRIAVARSEESDAFERERDAALKERDHLREVVAWVLDDHNLGLSQLRPVAVAILRAAIRQKEEEEDTPSSMNLTVGEQADDATEP